MKPRRRSGPPPARPNGTVAAIFAACLPVMLGFIGFVIDLSMLYLRNTELQQLADATAVAAAHELDGTADGVERALERARSIAVQISYGGPYRDPKLFFEEGDSWSDSALFVGTSLNGPWVRASSVTSDVAAANLLYARVNTGELASLPGAPGLVSTTVLRALSGSDRSVTAAPASVAARVGMRITPLGVCALSTVKFDKRQAEALTPAPEIAPELVEFGFRRGITYDLRNLNPSGSSGQPFLVNPVAPGAYASQADHFTQATLKPFFCSGTIAYGSLLPGRTVHVQPLNAEPIHRWLNSRFNDYLVDGCTKNTAPPDGNIREFLPPYGWMPAATTSRAADSTLTTDGARVTIADVRVKVKDESANYTDEVTAPGFGPFWIYSKPVHYVAGSATGAASTPQVFTTADWPALYQVSSGTKVVAPTNYPSSVPASVGPTVPSGLKQAGRRVLNLPLLDCSESVSGTATVLGVGRFYMPSKATSAAVYGEFAGLAPAASLDSSVSRLK